MLERARQTLAGGVSSPFRAKAPVPLYFQDGCGARLVDVDGNSYIDYTLAWGPNILGYRHPRIVEAVTRAAQGPHTYGAQHEMEFLVSERVCDMVPCAERVTFSSSGSEALHLAWRLARAFTGRNVILKFEGHYHGWFDSVLISYKPSPDQVGSKALGSRGQAPNNLDNVAVARWNLIDEVERALQSQEIAAVVMEPVLCNSGCIVPRSGYLQAVADLCRSHGALLVFDEVITGFRVALGGAQSYYGVTPDLATFGKAIAGGLALSAVAGRAEILEMIVSGGVAFGGSFNGNPLVMAAADATLEELSAGALDQAHHAGARLMVGIRRLAEEMEAPLLVTGFPAAFALHFTSRQRLTEYRDTFDDDRERLNRFIVRLLEEGVNILADGRMYVSTAHSDDDVDETLRAFEAALSEGGD
jgi:glutamate-1-semialdehyde 2,1-aminomutase